MLMGLVTKNAILLVDYAKVLQTRGMERTAGGDHGGQDEAAAHPDDDAAMIFGMLPLALGIGAGAEERAAMARAVVGVWSRRPSSRCSSCRSFTPADDFAAWMRRRWEGRGAGRRRRRPADPAPGDPCPRPRAAVAADSADVDVLTLDDVVRITLENNRTSARPGAAQRHEGKYGRGARGGPAAARRLRRGSRSWDTTRKRSASPGEHHGGRPARGTSPCTRGGR